MSQLNDEEDDEFYDSEPSFAEPDDEAPPSGQAVQAPNLSGELYEDSVSSNSPGPGLTPAKKADEEPGAKPGAAVPKTPSVASNASAAAAANRPTIYAIQFLNASDKSVTGGSRIFMSRENAMKALKEDPDNRRFKQFKTFDEAYVFSYESQEIESGQAPTLAQVQAQFGEASPAKGPASESATEPTTPQQASTKAAAINPAQDAEKLPFSAPKKPEINALRSMIEKNDVDGFKEKVLANPRFLISAGDTPVAVQESFRYNALHVCAKDNRHQICQFLLGLLSSTSYMQKLYRNDTPEQSRARTVHLLDSYLNTAEKGIGETPLHFACKFGSLEVARLLLANPHCDKAALNKFGKSPNDIICTKATTEAAKKNAEEIASLFENCYFVTLYRDDDLGNVIVEKPSSDLDSSLKKSSSKGSGLAPPEPQTTSPFAVPTSQRKLAAFVGPVSPKIANSIYEKLKSPARLGRQSPNNIDILRSDDYKGYERIVRKLTEDMNLPWNEYWEFLRSYCNFKSAEGQVKLETYFKQKNLQRLLDMQVKAAQNIRSDRLNNNSDLPETQVDFAKSELHRKLGELIDQIEKLKLILDLNDSNTLSLKYEQFVHLFEANPSLCKSQLPIKLPSNPVVGALSLSNYDAESISRLNEELINNTLGRYMSLVIDVSKLDNSGRCYFKFYKASKSIIDAFSCQDLFTTFYLSPVYKSFSQSRLKNKTVEAASVRVAAGTGANLMDRLKEAEAADVAMTNPFELRQPVEQEPEEPEGKQDEDEQDDDEEAEKEEEQPGEEKMFDAQYTLADEAKSDAKKLDIMDELEILTQKMKANCLDSADGEEDDNGESSDRQQNDEKNEEEESDEDEYRLNRVDNKVYDRFGQRDASSRNYSECLAKQMFQQKHQAQEARNLFIFGDGPSKLDRAVYLAMQDVNVDPKKFPLLNEWFQYMKSCKANDMQRWQTPSKSKKPQMLSPFPRKIS